MHKLRFPDKWDWHGCDAVEFDPEKLSGRATVGPIRFEADTVLECFHAGMSVNQILEDYGLDQGWERQAIEKILAFAAAKGFQPID
jgi:uncharacterized protein (DUF433 family)